MRLRFMLVLCLIGFLVTATARIIAQESDEATKAKIEQRDQLEQKAMTLANSGELDKATDYSAAIKAATECMAIREKVLGKQHRGYKRQWKDSTWLCSLRSSRPGRHLNVARIVGVDCFGSGMGWNSMRSGYRDAFGNLP